MKKNLCVVIVTVLSFCLLCGCVNNEIVDKTGEKKHPSSTSENGEVSFEENEYFTKFDQNYIYDENARRIDLSGGTVTIAEPGTYILEGKLEDGQVIVNVSKEEKVKLVLNNIDITCSYSSAILIKSADKVSLILPEGTVNTVTDCKKYQLSEEDPNACIYSKDDLSINGSGTLNVNALYNNGIGTKNDLRIAGGIINISAVKNGLKGNDSVAICGGTITILKAEDGIKSDSTDFQEGFVYISGGKFDITCNDDGIQASQDITVEGGEFNFSCEGKKVNSKGTLSVSPYISE